MSEPPSSPTSSFELPQGAYSVEEILDTLELGEVEAAVYAELSRCHSGIDLSVSCGANAWS